MSTPTLDTVAPSRWPILHTISGNLPSFVVLRKAGKSEKAIRLQVEVLQAIISQVLDEYGGVKEKVSVVVLTTNSFHEFVHSIVLIGMCDIT